MTEDTARQAQVGDAFRRIYGSEPEILVRAPGRVNLIGEHTDYNGGFVFPAAIDRDILIAASRRNDRKVQVYTMNFNQNTIFRLDGVEKTSVQAELWSNYLRAMAWVFEAQGLPTVGLNCVTQGNVPLGAGLSSSAAFLVAGGMLFAAASEIDLSPVDLALMAQRGEREFVGVHVGIMDQFIAALGQKHHALFIDTRDLTYEAVPLPTEGVCILIANTNKARGLVDSEYNMRRAECEEAVTRLRAFLPDVRLLRDVRLEDWERYGAHLPEVVQRRARHVITEDVRTVESIALLKAGDLTGFGARMNASHESLRFDYEVSCAELDALVEAARSVEGVYGSRMTGAGFGGCTVSLVAEEAVDTFQEEVPRRYREATGLETTLYVTTAAQGAERLR
jgi:galactokinase